MVCGQVHRQSVIDTSSVSHSSGRPRTVSGNPVTGRTTRVATELILLKPILLPLELASRQTEVGTVGGRDGLRQWKLLAEVEQLEGDAWVGGRR